MTKNNVAPSDNPSVFASSVVGKNKKPEPWYYALDRKLGGIFSVKLLLTVTMVLQVILPAIVILVYVLIKGEQVVKQQNEILSKQLTSQTYQYVSSFMSSPFDITRFIAHVVGTQGMNYTNMHSARHVLFPFTKTYPDLKYIYYGVGETETYVDYSRYDNVDYLNYSYCNDGMCYYEACAGTCLETGLFNLTYNPATAAAYSMTSEVWYQVAIEFEYPRWAPPYIYGNTTLLSSIFPIHIDGDSNLPVIGVAGADYSIESVTKFLQQLPLSKNSAIYILDGKNRTMIASSKSEEVTFEVIDGTLTGLPLEQSQLKLVRKIAKTMGDSDLVVSHKYIVVDGRRMLLDSVQYKDQYDLDWIILILFAVDDYRGLLRTFRNTVLIVDCIVMVVSIVVGIVIAMIVTQPLVSLGRRMEELRKFEQKVVKVNQQGGHVDTDYFNSPLHEIRKLQGYFSNLERVIIGFSKYVPVEIVTSLISSGEDTMKTLNPFVESREVSILFTDILGFTSISERLEATVLMETLTVYFECVSSAIRRNQGTLDKYIGDAVMAFWNAPLYVEDHQYHAVLSAYEINRDLEKLNAELKQKYNVQYKTRVGVNSGVSLVGNSGSSFRLNYTVMGDPVNLASRLESLNNQYGTFVLISENCYEKVCDRIICRYVDKVAVKGKKNGTSIYHVLGLYSNPEDEMKSQLASEFTQIMTECYLCRKFADAIDRFNFLKQDFPDDPTIDIMVDRCYDYLAKPPPDNWDGIRKMNEK